MGFVWILARKLWVGELLVKCKQVLVLKRLRALNMGGEGREELGGCACVWGCQYLCVRRCTCLSNPTHHQTWSAWGLSTQQTRPFSTPDPHTHLYARSPLLLIYFSLFFFFLTFPLIS